MEEVNGYFVVSDYRVAPCHHKQTGINTGLFTRVLLSLMANTALCKGMDRKGFPLFFSPGGIKKGVVVPVLQGS